MSLPQRAVYIHGAFARPYQPQRRNLIVDQLRSQHVEAVDPSSQHLLKTEHILAVVIQVLEELPSIEKLIFVSALPKDLEAAVRKGPAKENGRKLILGANAKAILFGYLVPLENTANGFFQKAAFGDPTVYGT